MYIVYHVHMYRPVLLYAIYVTFYTETLVSVRLAHL